jgi:hypothetical protein
MQEEAARGLGCHLGTAMKFIGRYRFGGPQR